MSTANYAGIDDLLQQLQAVQRRRWAIRCGAGLCALCAAAGGSVVAVAALLGYWPGQPPEPLRWAALAGVAGAMAVAVGLFAKHVLLWRQRPAQVALFVERAKAGLRNNLINAVLLADDADQPSPRLVQQAIDESVRSARHVDFVRAVSARPLKRWSLAAVCAAAAVLLLARLQGGALRRGVAAVVSPGSYVPHVNAIVAESITPGDVTVFTGQSVTVVARIGNPGGAPYRASVVLPDTGQSQPMLASDGNTTYTATLGPIADTLRYVVRIDRSRWPADRPSFTITAVQRLAVESLAVRYECPPYTGIETRTIPDFHGRIEAPAGSTAHLTLTLNQPAPAVRLDVDGGAPTAMQRGDEGRAFTVPLPVRGNGRYRLLVTDAAGQTLQRLPDGAAGEPRYDAAEQWFPIIAVPDAPPRITFVSPGQDVSASLDSPLPTRVQASDDYGLSSARLYAARQGEPFKQVYDYPVAGGRGGRFSHELALAALGALRHGDVIEYYAEATDTRDLPGAGPQTNRSKQFRVTVRDAAAHAAELARRQDELRRRLQALLAAQAGERVNTAICLSEHETLADVAATAERIVAGQQAIGVEIVDLAENFAFDAETVTAQHVLAGLAEEEAPLAVDQARVLAEVGSFAARVGACQVLGRTQDAIITRLEMLLAVMAASAQPDVAAVTPSDDPDGARQQAIDKLRNDLAEFTDAQQRLIQATSELAKKPMDDFTAADEQLLADLQAEADRLEKFIEETFSDLSKLPRQDFSNPSLLAELMCIKTDVTMASDALSKKAVEIAVAVEQAGLENAESLTANLEKWLPDEPDRKKWSMEDAAQPENVEQAELPEALEDLVGDLLEEEEDLFDEIDDLSSTWADSLDKGAGWSAMDGPISSMNAQGVTGNQLPNTSEIAGRSAEGRTGKAGGEYVQADAVGKGGRRTPTRLTGEPYQAGQIDDASAEPPGGATGGGKLSGAGAEGLQGPLPPEINEQMKRLAGQQAAIVNRAERLREQFDPGDYAAFRLLEAITLMKRVESDLANYRYRNVLRARQVTLGALRDARDQLTAEVDVVQDASADIPKYLREKINDAMDADLPSEHREHLQQYYRRIGAEGGQ